MRGAHSRARHRAGRSASAAASRADGPSSLRSRPGEGLVAGVDEVGRGPLAGPVVAAAVILDPARPIAGLRDSKELSPAQRRRLAIEIRRESRAFGLGCATVAEIDAVNILQASLLAMERAVRRLRLTPTCLRIDGNRVPLFASDDAHYLAEAVVGGDKIDATISAASILAKVCRDRLLERLHRQYPEYGWDRNKGYATPGHLRALQCHGPTPLHRRSFAPVSRALEELSR
jgi:ribonuclease HII